MLLTTEQQEEIISSQRQIENGLYVAQAALDDEIEKWQKKIIWSHKATIKLSTILEFYAQRSGN